MIGLDVASLVISILSFFATIAISFVIYFLERKNTMDRENKEIKEEARRFILENADERDYLHWATIAAGCFPQNKHIRRVYNNFSLLDDRVKKEVLNQVGMDIDLIPNFNWVNEKIDMIKDSIKRLDIGDDDFLYDVAKFFHRLYRYKDKDINQYSAWVEKYDDVFGLERMFSNNPGKVCFSRYLDDYLYCKYTKPELFSAEWIKPLTYMNVAENIYNGDEKHVCFWIAEEISEVMIFAEKYLNYYNKEHVQTDAQAETFEDRYFEVLYDLYYFYQKDEVKRSEK